MQNRVTVKVDFPGIPGTNTDEYDQFVIKFHKNMESLKNNIVSLNADDFDRRYYLFESGCYEALKQRMIPYVSDMDAVDVDYSIFSRLSDEYGSDIRVTVMKYGVHVADIRDPGDPLYYNHIFSEIKDGKIVLQELSHICSDGKLLDYKTVLSADKCVSDFMSLKSVVDEAVMSYVETEILDNIKVENNRELPSIKEDEHKNEGLLF